MDVHSKFEALKAKGQLPSPKGVALRVIQLTQKDDVTNQEIAHAIKADPALSGRIIKIANALVAYQTRPVASISDAVTVLGLNTVRQLVMGLSLVENSHNGPCCEFDYQGFWTRSLLAAITAQNLVLNSGVGSPEEVFILGLLGQIGSLALATACPEEYASVLKKSAAQADVPLADLERAEFGIDHNQMTQAMLADWGMPQVFQEVALYHEDPAQSNVAEGSRNWRMLHVQHVADYLSKVCLTQDPQRRKMVPKLILIATRLGVESDMLTVIGDKSIKEWQEWSKLFGIRSVEVPPFAKLLEAVPLAPDIRDIGELPKSTDKSYNLRVLLVDDDRATLLLMKTLLEQAGHTVATAGNGMDALGMVEKFMPQLIITDWVMPKMDGIEFCKALRKNPVWRNIYVFIMTAQEGADRLVEAFKAGANDYMTKPINIKVLGARLGAGQRVVQLQEELEFDRQELRKFSTELAASNDRLQQMALTDVLTNLPNRRFANEHLERQWAGAERSGSPLSCMLVDIDHFKKINDTHGHKTGDDALKHVSEVLLHAVRKQDAVCRFGGEEFLVICPDTPADQAFQYAERLRRSVAETAAYSAGGQEFNVTVSIGLASKKPILPSTEILLQLADKRLYAAKKAGRNCTIAN
ncbi:MAG: diguanylate cyclase [Gallionella sp.]|nr:diguanylate cyclase [Gallionella sp.]